MIPFVSMMIYSVLLEEAERDFTGKEIEGVKINRAAVILMHAVQDLRGARYQGKAEEEELRRHEAAWAELMGLTAEYGEHLELGADVERLTSPCAPGKVETPEASSRCLESMLVLIEVIGDRSNLLFDPVRLTYFFTDLLILRLPELAEQLAHARGRGARALTADNADNLRDIFIREESMLFYQEEKLRESVARITGMDGALATELRTEESLAAVSAFFLLLDATFVKQTDRPESAEFFAVGSRALTALYDLHDKGSVIQLRLLEERNRQTTIREIIYLAVVSVIAILSFLVQLSIARSVTRPLSLFQSKIDELASAESDLTRRIEYDGQDELGQIALSINIFIKSLEEIVRSIGTEAGRVAEAAAGLSRALGLFSTAAQDQASATEESAAAIEELTSSIENVLVSVQHQNQSVGRANENLTELNSATASSRLSIESLSSVANDSARDTEKGRESVALLEDAMQSIQEKSQKIEEILGIIDGISEQTSLLALNASIEAARAGEHGRGFAVVAEEISQLAEKTARNTRHIQELVRETGQAVSEGASRVKGSTGIFVSMARSVTEIARQTKDVEDRLGLIARGSEGIASSMQSVTALAGEIEAASREQSRGGNEINQAVSSISRSADDLQKETERMSKSAQELLSVAEKLKALVSRFQTS